MPQPSNTPGDNPPADPPVDPPADPPADPPSNDDPPADPPADPPKKDEPPADPPKKDEPPADPPAAGAPEKYDDFTVAEGFTWGDGELEQAEAFAKEAGLTQEQAQKYVDSLVNNSKVAGEAYAAVFKKAIADRQEAWKGAVKDDPDLGGNNLEKTLANAAKAIQSFGKEVEVKDEKGEVVKGKDGKPQMKNDLREALEITGAGDHPVIVRVFEHLGRLMGEGGVVHGNMSGASRSLGQRLYANSGMNP